MTSVSSGYHTDVNQKVRDVNSLWTTSDSEFPISMVDAKSRFSGADP
jgi:hypothetical protein